MTTDRTPAPHEVWLSLRGDAVRVFAVQTVNATDRLWVQYRRVSGSGRTARRMKIWMPLDTFQKKFKPGKALL